METNHALNLCACRVRISDIFGYGALICCRCNGLALAVSPECVLAHTSLVLAMTGLLVSTLLQYRFMDFTDPKSVDDAVSITIYS